MVSQVERTHQGSCEVVGGVGVGGETGEGVCSSSLSVCEDMSEGVLLRGEEENGTTAKSISRAKEGTYVELGSQAKTFSLNCTSLLIIIPLEFG
jgi:hypothetical protein